jgi:hypothetical protein
MTKLTKVLCTYQCAFHFTHIPYIGVYFLTRFHYHVNFLGMNRWLLYNISWPKAMLHGAIFDACNLQHNFGYRAMLSRGPWLYI